jgi:HEAT repeat protein
VGENAELLEMLLKEIRGGNPQMRAAAVANAALISGENVTLWWTAKMKGAPPAARAAVLDMLGRRGDVAALATVLGSLKDVDESVRVAAIGAAAALGKEMVVPPLAAALTSESDRERSAARKALTDIPGEAADETMAMSFDGAAPEARCELLAILAARDAKGQLDVVLASARDKDAAVRLAALKALSDLGEAGSLPSVLELLVEARAGRELQRAEKAALSICGKMPDKQRAAGPVLAALPRSKGKARCSFLKILSRLGTGGALAAVRAALEDGNEAVRYAAVKALAAWPDAAAAPDLLKLARSAPKKTHRIFALRGYVRAAGLTAGRAVEAEGQAPLKVRPALTGVEALKMYELAAGLAERAEEKRMILSALAALKHPGALGLAEKFLDDGALKDEAAAAVVKIARELDRSHRGRALSALRKVLRVSRSKGVVREAREAIEAIEKR